MLAIYPPDKPASEILRHTITEITELDSAVSVLKTRIQELETKSQRSADRLLTERIKLEREQLLASNEYRRRKLLTENWKAMRSVEFEQFLERVFVELGYGVETTKVTGDQGVDLVVSNRSKRIAIQVKGYLNSVSGGAIQEAFTGMACYRCDGCAVITNSLFIAFGHRHGGKSRL